MKSKERVRKIKPRSMLRRMARRRGREGTR
jgi:hypothetical protein